MEMEDPARAPVGDDDGYGGRAPTSHERMGGRPWDASYVEEAPAPWDIGRPQPAVVRLADRGVFEGAVLDAGCGSGENALHLASAGLQVLGFDVASTAVSRAREKATTRGLEAEFVVADALDLGRLGRTFDTVLDCALFHAFDPGERRAYVASLAPVVRSGGMLYVLCFREATAGDAGPHPVSEQEFRAPFDEAGGGWQIASLGAERLEMNLEPYDVPAWLAEIERV
jgi:SAM-dependent methyltransferase